MFGPSRLDTIINPLRMIWLSTTVHFSVFKQSLRTEGLSALLHIRQISNAASAKLLIMAAPGFITHENTTSVPKLVASATGQILELGPGPGNQIHRYDPSHVEMIYAIDPNTNYEAHVAMLLKRHDLQDKYKFVACRVEDREALRAEGISAGSMDTVVSIQTLCAVDDVKQVLGEVYRLLKPGGRFVFWEHERNREDGITAMTQAFWNPFWSRLVGCNLNRRILEDILAAGEWENPDEIEVVHEPYSVLPRIWGTLRKRA